MPIGHAMLPAPIKKEAADGDVSCIPSLQSQAIGWDLSERINMKFKHILALLCAVSVSVVLAATASAQDKTVKIGGIFPLSGNAASTGVHTKAALEVAMDIINNAHPELGNLPLAKNAGLAGLGGGAFRLLGDTAGMHVVLELPYPAERAVAAAAGRGLALYCADRYYAGPPTLDALVLGYGGIPLGKLRRAATALRAVLAAP